MSRKMTPLVLGLGWLVSLGAVFILGILSAFALHLKPGEGGAAAAASSEKERRLAWVIEEATGEPADLAAIFSHDRDEVLPDALIATLRTTLNLQNPVDLEFKLRAIAEGLPSRKVPAVVRWLIENGFTRDGGFALGIFIQEWAKSDGRSALAFSRGLTEARLRSRATGDALTGWAMVRLDDAWSWILQQEEGPGRERQWLSVLVDRLVVDRPGEILSKIASLESPGLRFDMAAIAGENLAAWRSPDEAIRWITDLPDDGSRREAIRTITNVWAEQNPEACANWILNSTDLSIDWMQPVVNTWSYQAPEAAMNWTWEQFEGPARKNLLGIASSQWVEALGPASLADWINENGPHPDLDLAIQQLALGTASVEPRTALSWVHNMSSGDDIAMMEIEIGQQWMSAEPEVAEAELYDLLLTDAALRYFYPDQTDGRVDYIITEEAPDETP